MVPEAANPDPALHAAGQGLENTTGLPPAGSPVTTGRYLCIAIGMLFVAFAWPVIKRLVNVYENNPDYSHGYVVPIVALYALHLGWADRVRIPVRASWLGFPLVLFGMALVLLGSLYGEAIHHDTGLGPEFLSGIGLVTAISGGTVSMFGLRRSWHFAFPLLYLFFAVPFPESVRLGITLPLREFITILAGRLISLMGIHVYQEGNLLHLAGVSLGVEDACSGIRSLLTMLAGSVAIAFVARCNRWQMAIVALAAIPLAMLQNLARVFITALLVHNLDIKYAEGWRHETVGWLTFILAGTILLYFALRISAKTHQQHVDQSKPTDLPAPHPPRHHYHTTALPLYTSLILLLAGGSIAQGLVYYHYNNNSMAAQFTANYASRHELEQFPPRVGDFTLRVPFEMPESQLEMLGPSDYFCGVYEDGTGNTVSVMLFYWESTIFQTRSSSKHPHPATICLPGSGFQRIPLVTAPRVPESLKYEYVADLFSNGQQEMAVVYWRSPGMWHQDFKTRLLILKESWDKPAMKHEPEYSVGLYAPVVTTPKAALETALRFARALGPILEPYGMKACRHLSNPAE